MKTRILMAVLILASVACAPAFAAANPEPVRSPFSRHSGTIKAHYKKNVKTHKAMKHVVLHKAPKRRWL